MEELFVETVSKLSKRVNLLESQEKVSASSQEMDGIHSSRYQGGEMTSRTARIEPGGRVRSANSVINQANMSGVESRRSMIQSNSAKSMQQNNGLR